MSFWIGLIIGLMVGGFVGLFTAALCFAAKRGDQMLEAAYWGKNGVGNYDDFDAFEGENLEEVLDQFENTHPTETEDTEV